MSRSCKIIIALISLLFISANAFAQEAYTWTGLGADDLWSNSANWTSVPAGTFPGDGSSDDTVTISSGTPQLDANETIAGLTVATTGSLGDDTGSYSLTVGGNVDLSGTGSWSANITLAMTATSSLDSDFTLENLFIFAAGNTVSLGTDLTLNGWLQITSGTLSTGANSVSVGGNATIGGILDASGQTGAETVSVSGNVTGGGTFSAGAGDVGITGNVSVTTLTAGSGDVDIDGNISVTNFTESSGQTNIGGDYSVTNLTLAAGLIVFDNTADSTVVAETFNDVQISANTTMTGDWIVEDLTIDNGDTLTTGTNSLQVNGDTAIAGTLDATSQTAAETITLAGSLSGAGTFNGGAGDITFTGAPASIGMGITTTGGDIIFNNAVNLTSDVALDSAGGNISFGSTVATGGNNLTLDGGAAGNLTITGALTGGGDFSVTDGAVQSYGALTVNSLNITDATTSVTFGGTITTTTTIDVNSGGTIVQTGAVASGTNLDYDAGSTLAINNTIGVSETVAIDSTGVTTIAAGANITAGGAVAFGAAKAGTLTTSGDIDTSADNITFTNAVTLGGTVDIDSAGGDILFSSTIATAGNNLALDGGAGGNITLSAALTGGGDMSVRDGAVQSYQGLTINSLNINDASTSVTFGDTITSTTTIDVVSGGTIVQSGAVASGTNLDYDAGTTISISDTIGVSGTVDIDSTGATTIAAGGDINAGGAVTFGAASAGTLTTSGNIDTSNDNITFTNAVTLGGAADFDTTGAAAGNILFNSTIDTAGNALSLDAGTAGNITLSGALTGGGAMTVRDGAVQSYQALTINSLNINDASTSVTFGNTITSTTTIDVNSGGTIVQTGAVASGTNLDYDAATTIAINNTIGVSGTADIDSTGVTTIAAGANITAGGAVAFGAAKAGTLTTSGDIDTSADNITFTNAVSLGGDVDIDSAGGDILFSSTIATAGNNLALDGGGGGNITLSAALTGGGDMSVRDGAVQSYQGLTVNSLSILDATTSVTTAGNLTATTTVDIVSGGTVTLGNTVVAPTGFSSSGTTFDNTGGAITTTNNDITINHTTSATIGAALASGTGAILVTTDTIAVGANISGTGTIQLRPSSAGRLVSLGLAGGAEFDLTNVELGFLQDGFSQVTLGRNNAGAVSLDTVTLTDPAVIRGGAAVTLDSIATSQDNARITVYSGALVTVSGNSSAHGSGNIDINSGGGFTLSNGITMSSTSGNITVDTTGANALVVNGDITTGVGGTITLTGTNAITMDSTSLLQTANGTITVSSAAGGVTVDVIESTGDAAIGVTATGSTITEADNTARVGAAGSTTALTLSAGSGIGGAGAAALNTDVSSITSAVTGAGNHYISEADAVTLTDIDTFNGITTISAGGTITATDVVTGGNTLTISTSAGNIELGSIDTNGEDAVISSAGGIDETNPEDGAVDLIAGNIDLDAVDGIGETRQPEFEAATSIDADTTGGTASIDININTMAGTTLSSPSTAGAASHLTVDCSGGGQLAVTSANTANGRIDISVDNGDLNAGTITAGGANNILLDTTTSGDVEIGTLTATGDQVTISSVGSINDDGAGNPDITADTVDLDAATGIGAATTIQMSGVTAVTADNTGAFDINIDNDHTAAVAVNSLTTAGANITFNQTGVGGTLDIAAAGTGIFSGNPANGGDINISCIEAITVNDVISSAVGAGGTLSFSGATINTAPVLGQGNIGINGGGAGDTIVATDITSAASIAINATRDIIIQALVQTTDAEADITLTADSDDNGSGGVQVQTAGQVDAGQNAVLYGADLNANAGRHVEIQSDGVTNQVLAGGSISLLPRNAGTALTAEQTVNGRLQAVAGVTITANGDVAVGADGDITPSAAGDVNNISITADNRAGNNGHTITMANGAVFDAGAGTVNLSADGDIGIASVQTTNNTAAAVDINTANGAISDTGAVTNIQATSANAVVTIKAETGIGNGNAIETDITSLDAVNDTSGNIEIDESNSITITQATQSTDGNISITAAGSITADSGGAPANVISTLLTGTVTLYASGAASDITVNDGISTATGTISLDADNDIIFDANGDITSTSGNVTVAADSHTMGTGALTMANGTEINSGSGDITLAADEDITLGYLVTTSALGTAVDISSNSGAILDTADGGAIDIRATNAGADVTLYAAATIGVLGGDVLAAPTNALEVDIRDLVLTGDAADIAIASTTTGANALEVDMAPGGAGAGAALITTDDDLDIGIWTLTNGANSDSVGLVSSGGNINIPDADIDVGTGTIRIEAANAGQDVDDGVGGLSDQLWTAGNVEFYSGSSEAIATSADTLTAAVAGAGNALTIWEQNGIDLVDIDVADGLLNITVAAGDLTITDIATGTDAADNNIAIIVQGGDVEIDTITTDGAPPDASVTITADTVNGQDVLDSDGDSTITANAVSITARGDIGAMANRINTTVGSMTLSSTNSGDIFINETDAVTLTNLDTVDGRINIRAAGAIDAQDVQAGGGGDTDDVEITATSGNIEIDVISAAGSGDVDIMADTLAAQEITDADSNSTITADELRLVANAGIGNTDRINTTVVSTAMETNTGDIRIGNTADLAVETISGLDGVQITGGAVGDDIDVNAAGQFLLRDQVTNTGGGDVILGTNGATAAHDIHIGTQAAGSVTAAGGNGSIFIYAGDTIDFSNNADVIVAGSGNVQLSAGTGYNPGVGLFNGNAAGGITMTDGCSVESDDGSMTLRAPGDIVLAEVTADADLLGAVGNVTIMADYDGVDTGLSDNIGTVTEVSAAETYNLYGNTVAITAPTGIGDAGVDDIEVTIASTALNADSSAGDGDIYITSTSAMPVGLIDAGTGDITLVSGGAITDTNAGAANIVSADLDATAAGGVSLDTSLSSLSVTTSAAGLVNIDETDGITLNSISTNDGSVTVEADGLMTATSVTSGGAGNSVVLTTNGAGNSIVIGAISSADTVNITSADNIADAANDGVTDITAVNGDTITLTADGDIDGPGAADTYLDLAAGSIVDADSTNDGHVYLRGVGAVILQDIDANNGPITVTAAGQVTATDVVSTTDLDVNDITISTTSGNILVGTITAGSATSNNADVFLTAVTGSQSVVDNASAVTCDTLTIRAGDDIGAVTNILTEAGFVPINTLADSLDLESGSDLGAGAVIAINDSAVLPGGPALTNVDSVSGDAGMVLIKAVGHLDGTGTTGFENTDEIALVSANGTVTVPNGMNAFVLRLDGVDLADDGDADIDLAATSYVLKSDAAEDFTIFAGFGFIDALTNGAMTVVHSAGDIEIDDLNGDGFGLRTTAAGNVDFRSTGSISVSDDGNISVANGNLKILADSDNTNGVEGLITMAAGSSMNAGSGTIDIDAHSNITLTTVTTTNDTAAACDIDSEAGDITFDSVAVNTTAGQMMIETGTGLIAESGAGDAGVDLTAHSLELLSATGIGSANPIETQVSDLAAEIETSGNLQITNTGALDITTVNATSGLVLSNDGTNNGGDILVRALSPITVTDNVLNYEDGNIILAAEGSAATDDMTVNNNVTVFDANGLIELYSGDTFSQAAGTISTNGGDIAIAAGVDYNGGGLAAGNTAADVSQTDGLSIVSVTGNVTVTAPEDISVSVINTGGNISLTANDSTYAADNNSGAITDNLAAETANLTGADCTLSAATGIGSADDIETDVASLSADNSDSGNIQITEADAVTVVKAVQGTDDDINITTTNGTLTADSGGAPANVISTLLAGTVTLDANGAGSDIIVNDGISTAGGIINLLAADAVTFAAEGDVSSSDGTVTVDAGTGSVTMTNGALINAGAGLIDIDAQTNILLGGLLTTNNTNTSVTLTTTAGAVIDNGIAHVDAVSGGRLVIDTQNGIGSGAGLEIDTSVVSLDLDNSAGGDVQVIETDAVTVVRAVIAAGGGDIDIQTDDGSLTVSGQVSTTGGGTIDLYAGDSLASNDDNLNIQSGITAVSGKVTLSSQTNDVVFTATGDVTTTASEIEVNAGAAGAGFITMADGTVLRSITTGQIDINGVGDVTIGQLITVNATNSSINILTTNGAVIDGRAVDGDDIQSAGRLTVSAQTGIGNGNEFGTDVAQVVLNNGTSGNIQINETDDVVIFDMDTVDGNIIFSAGDAILANTIDVVDSGATGDWSLDMDVAAGGITLTTTNADYDIDVNAAGGNVSVGQQTAGHDVRITSAVGDVRDGGGADSITAGDLLTIDAATGVGSGDPIDIEVVRLDVDNTTSGNIQLDEATTVSINKVNNTGAGPNSTIINAANNIIVVSGQSGITSTNGTIELNPDGNGIINDGLTTTNGGTIGITCGIDLTFGAGGDVASNNGKITLTATTGTGHVEMDDDTRINAGAGLIEIDAAGDLTIGELVTTSVDNNSINIDIDGEVIDGGDTYNDIISGGRLAIDAANGIGAGGALTALETDVASVDIDNTTGGDVQLIQVNGIRDDIEIVHLAQAVGAVDISTAAASDGTITVSGDVSASGAGGVSLTAGGSGDISVSAQIDSGTGTLGITASGDDITIGGANPATDLLSESGAVNLTGDLTLDDNAVIDTTDNLSAGANITINDAVFDDGGGRNLTITAGTEGDVTISDIIGGGANAFTDINIDGNDITLTGIGDDVGPNDGAAGAVTVTSVDLDGAGTDDGRITLGGTDYRTSTGTQSYVGGSDGIVTAFGGASEFDASAAITFNQLYLDHDGWTLTMLCDFTVGRLIFYRGTLDVNDKTLTTTDDLVVFGGAYDPDDADRGADDDEFKYPEADGLDYYPDGDAYNNPTDGDFETAPNATFLNLGTSTLTVGGDFYVNGTNMNGTAWTLNVADNTVSNPVFGTSWGSPYAIAFNMTVTNCSTVGGGNISAAASVGAGDLNNIVTDGGGNMTYAPPDPGPASLGWDFDRPQITSIETVYDNMIRITFSEPIENSNGEINTVVSNITFDQGATAYSGAFFDSDGDQSTPPHTFVSTNTQDDLTTFFLQRTGLPDVTWNTDATGGDDGDAMSTNREGVHITGVEPDLTMLKGVFFDAGGHNMSRDYGVDALATFTATTDECRPALVNVAAGRAERQPGSELIYDAHNYFHLRYSEPVDIGTGAGFTIADVTGVAGAINQRAEATFTAAGNHGGEIIDDGSSVEVEGYFSYTGRLPNGSRDGDSDGYGNPASTFYRDNTDGENPSGTHGLTLYIAGYRADTASYYPGYIGERDVDDLSSLGEADMTAVGLSVSVSSNAFIQDADGNAVEPSSDTYDIWNPTIEAIDEADGSFGSVAGLAMPAADYSGWDVDPPIFSIYESGPPEYYEIVSRATSSTGLIDRLEFFIRDDGTYMTTAPNIWAPETDHPEINPLHGIRDTSLTDNTHGSDPDMAFKIADVNDETLVNTYNNGLFTDVDNTLFGTVNTADDAYFVLKLTDAGYSWNAITALQIEYDSSVGLITDLAGNLIPSSSSSMAGVERIPPIIELTLASVGDSKIYVLFSEPVFGNNSSPRTDITASDFSLSTSGITITDVEEISSLNGGIMEAWFSLSASLTADAAYSVKIIPNAAAVYDKITNAMQADDIHRVTDIGIGLMEPIWATDSIHNSSYYGDTDMSLRDFDGTGYLTDSNITLEASISADTYSVLSTSLYYDVNPADSVVDGGFWLPSYNSALVPAANDEARGLVPFRTASSVRDFLIPSNDSEIVSGSEVEFLLKFGDLFCARLLDSDDPRTILPWSFTIKDIKKQTAGVTILNNVINPENGEQTILTYDLETAGMVVINVFNLAGDLINIIQRGAQGTGTYTYTWDGTNRAGNTVARGVYFIRVVGPDIDEYRKVMIVK